MTSDLIRVDPETLLGWPSPIASLVPADIRDRYTSRKQALEAYMSGSSLQAAATQFHVSRGTLARIVRLSTQLDAAGIPWGYRVCLPYFRTDVVEDDPATPPAAPATARPHSFGTLLKANTSLSTLVHDFTGKLPVGRRRSPAFDRLFRQLKHELAGAEHLYPLNTKDQGRRALLEWLKRKRQRANNVCIANAPPPRPALERLDQLFPILPFMRGEYDAHHTDDKIYINVPTPDGGTTKRKLREMNFIPDVDVATRLITSWVLVLGKGYKQYDLMALFAKAMCPWEPCVITTPDLCLLKGAGMPSVVMPDGKAPRIMLQAGDNFQAHKARSILYNMLHVHLGVWNWAQAHIPEKRGVVESLFHHLEQGALRGIPGGYLPPGTESDTPTPTNGFDPKLYPLNAIALGELLEFIVTAHNADGECGPYGHSPLEAAREYLERGGWVWQSSLSERHAEQLSMIPLHVTIRGSRRESRQPYVQWKGARYRSDALTNRFDLVGKKFRGAIPYNDLRIMTLYDASGNVFVQLPALPPWSTSKHDLRTREQVMQWDHAKVIRISGVEDALKAYLRHVRDNAYRSDKIAELYARNQGRISALNDKPAVDHSAVRVRIPRGGWIGAENMEDLP